MPRSHLDSHTMIGDPTSCEDHIERLLCCNRLGGGGTVQVNAKLKLKA